jgi:hypothetical protein
MTAASLCPSTIFDEIPLVTRSSSYSSAVISGLEDLDDENDWALTALEGVAEPVLEKNLEMVIDSLEEYYKDMGKYLNYTRNNSRYKAQLAQFMAKRKQETMTAQIERRHPAAHGAVAPGQPPYHEADGHVLQADERLCGLEAREAVLRRGDEEIKRN